MRLGTLVVLILGFSRANAVLARNEPSNQLSASTLDLFPAACRFLRGRLPPQAELIFRSIVFQERV